MRLSRCSGVACDTPSHCVHLLILITTPLLIYVAHQYQLTFEPKVCLLTLCGIRPRLVVLTALPADFPRLTGRASTRPVRRSYPISSPSSISISLCATSSCDTVSCMHGTTSLLASGTCACDVQGLPLLSSSLPLLPRPSHTNSKQNPNEAYEEFTDTADFLLTSVGALSRWNWPNIDGLRKFEGKLLHSANFDVGDRTWQEAAEEWQWKDKAIGVIGVVSILLPSRMNCSAGFEAALGQGSSAIQIVAALQPRVNKLVQFVRGKTWITPPFASTEYAELITCDQNAESCKSP